MAKTRAITSLKEQVRALQELDIPGWSGKNVQVQQQVIEVVSHIASTATKFPKISIAGICERVPALKTRAQAMKCLTTFSEAMGASFIFERLSKIMKEHKNPKVLSEGLFWMVSVGDFVVAHLTMKGLYLIFCKDVLEMLPLNYRLYYKNVFVLNQGILVRCHADILSASRGECDINPFEVDFSKATVFKKKLQLLKSNLKDWRKLVNSVECASATSLREKISLIDIKAEIGPLTSDEVMTRAMSVKELANLEYSKAKDLRKKSKSKWALEGDENSRFFHGILLEKML
ncbi:protein MOR1 [Tanacetum coccineum]|uniref:Protein MOR1 n=1 Tax=Tanacetum coccineum TaxID=301880 RepID=A0ABQ5AEC1_9ASTR